MKALIVDDDRKCHSVLMNLLKMHVDLDLDIIGNAYSVAEATKLLNSLEVDLVFLDVELADGTGFDILKQHELHNTKVIFVTAHESYLLRALRASAFDFLLKPINLKELKSTIFRAKKLNNVSSQQLENLLSNLNPNGALTRISVSSSRKIEYLELTQILYCKASNQYTEFYLSNGSKSVSSKNLGHYDELLEHSGFFRIHRSFLINIKHVKEYHRDTDFVFLSNNESLKLAHQFKSSFLKRMEY